MRVGASRRGLGRDRYTRPKIRIPEFVYPRFRCGERWRERFVWADYIFFSREYRMGQRLFEKIVRIKNRGLLVIGIFYFTRSGSLSNVAWNNCTSNKIFFFLRAAITKHFFNDKDEHEMKMKKCRSLFPALKSLNNCRSISWVNSNLVAQRAGNGWDVWVDEKSLGYLPIVKMEAYLPPESSTHPSRVLAWAFIYLLFFTSLYFADDDDCIDPYN